MYVRMNVMMKSCDSLPHKNIFGEKVAHDVIFKNVHAD